MDSEELLELETHVANARMLCDTMRCTLKYYEYEEGRFSELVYMCEIIEEQFQKATAFF